MTRAVPALGDNITAPVLNASIPEIPSASRSRTNSLSSSVLNLPAGRLPTPAQSPELNVEKTGKPRRMNRLIQFWISLQMENNPRSDGNEGADARRQLHRPRHRRYRWSLPMLNNTSMRRLSQSVLHGTRHRLPTKPPVRQRRLLPTHTRPRTLPHRV
ncbi:hypothetical protein BJ138DRAFT_1167355 [Hygrophoropsis aurantiaca]|uniref:Uncharacterized protein n=1 Tax=Hygrophoropsis aurantiaca TaxID=72124 RepID=A0ACB7ZS32_9AGAM|nr:hypothetical protein BJ138DRAFT_1167355 [Hygrophoropsis aurantiaca]